MSQTLLLEIIKWSIPLITAVVKPVLKTASLDGEILSNYSATSDSPFYE